MTLVNALSSSSVVRIDATPRAADRPASIVGAEPAPRPADTVDLSDQARLLDTLRSGGDVRQDLVAKVRSEIDQGSYLNDERLDKALDALIDEFLG